MLTELEEIKFAWKDCTKCTLCHEGRKQVVFSKGSETSRIMIVGEGPGATEDATGIPFSGPAGKLLDKILQSVHIDPKDCYFTNAVRCRPNNNRTPNLKEINTCKPLLLEEIRIIKPKVIIIVGRPAAESLIGLKGPIGEVAGHWTQTIYDIPAIIIYHPAAVLHTEKINPEVCEKYKRSIWESMKSLRAFLDQTIKVESTVKNNLSFDEQLNML